MQTKINEERKESRGEWRGKLDKKIGRSEEIEDKREEIQEKKTGIRSNLRKKRQV